MRGVDARLHAARSAGIWGGMHIVHLGSLHVFPSLVYVLGREG